MSKSLNKETMTQREKDNLKKFLDRNSKITLDEFFKSNKLQQDFIKWQNQHERIHLSYFIEGLSGSMFIRLSVEDLMDELTANPELKKYVLDYAKSSLKENPLSDKRKVVRAIKTENVDSLYNNDTEVRENFAQCFLEGAKLLRKDIYEQLKQHKDNSKTR